MKRGEAVFALISDVMRNSMTVASYKRAIRAMKALDLTDEEIRAALRLMDYHNVNDVPYLWLAKKLENAS